MDFDKMARLNLGAGSDIRPASEGWTNADIRDLPGIDVVCDAREPLPFADGAFDELVAQDLLEHLPPSQVESAINEWRRVLRPGGVLRLRFPDLVKLARRLLSGALSDDMFVWLVYGDQRPESGGTEWGSHKAGYTKRQIERLLHNCGFMDISVVEADSEEYNIYVAAVKSG